MKTDEDFLIDLSEKVDDGLEHCGDLYCQGKAYPYVVTFAEKPSDICIEKTSFCKLCIATDRLCESLLVEFDNGWKVSPQSILEKELTEVLLAFYNTME